MTVRIVWATDIHLEFCDDAVIDAFASSVATTAPHALLVTGDIGQAPSVCRYLEWLEKALACPLYFVLGNHDFYKGSITEVRVAIQALCRDAHRVRWLRDSSPVMLAPDVALVGVDGWGDGRLGHYARSPVMLNDFILIRELAGISPDERLRRMQALADADAAVLEQSLNAAVTSASRIVVATHVPPFAAAAWHEGKQSDDNWLPFFSCQAVGDVLLRVADAHPDRQLLVLCGHTHGGGELEVRPNLQVLTGPAEYGTPKVQRLFELG